MISSFGGLNQNMRIARNEFSDMMNMSSDDAPMLCPRKKRAVVRTFGQPHGIFAHDKLCWVDGTGFYYDGTYKGAVENSDKRFVRMGAYVLIFPDKKYYNAETGDFGSLEQTNETTTTVTAALCRRDGVNYAYTVSDTAPAVPTNGQYWLDTSLDVHTLKVYATDSGLWSAIASVYVKISATGIGAGMSEYDGVTISGMEVTELNGDFFLVGASDDAIVITAQIDQAATQNAAVTVSRLTPDMDYLCELNNRVWGCSSTKHEIYACKLGDPKNWRTYAGLVTDSYAVTVGSGGDFTGCASHLGYALFFKENMIHRMYGTQPSNFALSDNAVRGIAIGSGKSAAVVNEELFYHSALDVCMLQSALPGGVSRALRRKYTNASAGALGSKYYMSAKGPDGWEMLVYDIDNAVWHREDGTHATYFAACDGDLYYLNADDNKLYSVNGNIALYADESAEIERDFEWYATTGDLGLDAPDHKYVSGLQIMLQAEHPAWFRVELQYDNGGTWEEAYHTDRHMTVVGGDPAATAPPVKRAFTLPIHTRRCNTLRMRISGVGRVRVYSITKTEEQGSDRDGV